MTFSTFFKRPHPDQLTSSVLIDGEGTRDEGFRKNLSDCRAVKSPKNVGLTSRAQLVLRAGFLGIRFSYFKVTNQ